jgi:hypothetical protein
MKPRTHVFLAAFPASRGEITLALRIAKELNEKGDRVIFAACKIEEEVFRGRPVEFIPVDSMRNNFNVEMSDLVQRLKADSIVLVDILTNSVTFEYFKVPKTFFEETQTPVIALDVYRLINGRERGDLFFNRVIDFRYLNSYPSLKLYPVPFIPPDGVAGNYCSLSAKANIGSAEVAQLKSELGFSSNHKIILMVGTAWQVPSFWDDPHCRRISALSPLLITQYLNRLGPEVHVLHVGPEAYRTSDSFRDQYHWISPVGARRFQTIVAASDLFLTLNLVGTTVSTAITAQLPMVVVSNSISAHSVEEASSKMKRAPSEASLNWMNAALPIYRFLAWPIGYFDLVSPLLANNPFCETYRSVELLDEEGLVAACHELLYDQGKRAALMQAQGIYAEKVRSLPTGADLILRHLG